MQRFIAILATVLGLNLDLGIRRDPILAGLRTGFSSLFSGSDSTNMLSF